MPDFITLIQGIFPRRLLFRLSLPFRAQSVGVRAMICDGKDNILLVRHTYSAGWDFPGGGVKPGETAIDALCREVAEETNIRLNEPMHLVGVYLNRYLDSRDHILFYRCERWSRIAPFARSLEIAEARLFPIADLPPDITAGARRRIGELYDGQAISPVW